MIWKLAIAALVGYITRHLVGIVFKRMFKKRMPDLFDGAQFVIEKSEVREILVSFDAGKQWFIRTPTGWGKVNHDFVRKALDKNATDNPANHQPPPYPTVS